ncbi:DUF1648 domain-containing protein [Isoptericola haloaureus]|uniref:DUF1648 domain-containing protein n=1 Tax=Isoptericola haloaureus TaxID=1542902 RepID=A0ABU7Z6B3_9MICO
MTTHHDPTPAWRRRARRSTLWSSLAGLILTLAAAATVWSWRGDLPDQVATHWGPGGVPDDTMSVTGMIAVATVTAVVLLALFAVVGLAWGSSASTRRTAAGAAVWSGGLGAALLLVTAGFQRGLDTPQAAELPGWALAVILLAPLLPAVVAAALVPGDPAQPAERPVAADAPRATLTDSERAVWMRTAQGGAALVLGIGAVVATTVLAVVAQLWAMLLVPVLLAVLFAAMFAFRVRVDATGFTVRSVLGWPGTHVPADEVVEASVTRVSPLGDFGGWGWRVGFDKGRVGVVLRSGEAVLVERTGGRGVVVTVDDAARAAALLNTMADRARADRTPG